ncbi:MAG: BamA/TamA family outer membrane protein [bacterium]|nr:MAG: BamA/TamA family outer membrane protein [bacterium]
MEQELEEYGELAPVKSGTGMSLAPILAYEPTFGTIYGGAVFLDRPLFPQYRFFTRLAWSTEGEYSTLFDLQKWVGEDTYFRLELEVDDFARPYYGEGMDTDPDDQITLDGTVTRALYFMKFLQSGKVSMGPFLDVRGAEEKEVNGTGVPPPEYDEMTLGLGMRFFYDNRDSHLSPTKGVFDTLTVRYVPGSFSDYKGGGTFLQAEVDHRTFYEPVDGTVLAGRIRLARSWGDPSYQYRYFLGGPYELKGYYTNRFRGDNLYLFQGELRQDLFWIFSGAAFAELGEVAEDRFHSPETSYGAGLRMTLPPDHVAKVRLDFAWARDQKSIYFIFGEAF